MEIPDFDERGEKPLRISYSRLMQFEKCSMQAYLKKQGKVPDLPTDMRRFIHGTLADLAMRKWLDQDTPQLPGQMEAYVDELWDEVVVNNPDGTVKWKGDPIEDQAAVREMAKSAVRKIEPFLIARVIPFDYEPEFRFKVPLRIPDRYGMGRTVILNGGMDIAVRVSDSVVNLFDLKNTSNEQYVKGPIMYQLVFYALCWSVMFGPPEKLIAAYLTPNCKTQIHPLEITAETKRAMMVRIMNYAHAQWENEEPVCTTDKNTCYWCDVARACPLNAMPTTTDANGRRKISLAETAKARRQAKTTKDEK